VELTHFRHVRCILCLGTQAAKAQDYFHSESGEKAFVSLVWDLIFLLMYFKTIHLQRSPSNTGKRKKVNLVENEFMEMYHNLKNSLYVNDCLHLSSVSLLKTTGLAEYFWFAYNHHKDSNIFSEQN